MVELNSFVVYNTYSNLTDHTKFRWNQINKIKSYFNLEIQEKKKKKKNLVNTFLFLIILARL